MLPGNILKRTLFLLRYIRCPPLKRSEIQAISSRKPSHRQFKKKKTKLHKQED